MEIKFIQAEETLDLRLRVLRPGQNLELCRYAEDNLPTTFHVGLVVHQTEKVRVICNGTFIPQTHEELGPALCPYRLRGMATDPDFQRQGLGASLIRWATEELQRRKCDLLWFNARTNAEGFYEKLGFQKRERTFDIPGVGPHIVMFKWLR